MRVKILQSNYLSIPVGAVIEVTRNTEEGANSGYDITAEVVNQYAEVYLDNFLYFLLEEKVEVIEDDS